MKQSLFLAMAVAIALGAHAAPPVTFEQLLGELTDLDALTRMPDPAYTCRQFSSYDRRSTDPAVLTDENWFANGDAAKFLRTEEGANGTEHVLMDAEGPGAIVRFWSANPDAAGVIRIYLDGSETAAVEMPLMDMLGGETAPFLSPIAHTLSRGWNSYLPIPYARHCKVTASEPGFYYQINYRSYAPGTAVETFSLPLAEAALPRIEAVAGALKDPKKAFEPEIMDARNGNFSLRLQPGQVSPLYKLEGPGALYYLTAQVETDNVEKALRGTLLEIVFDERLPAAVQAPLGDFFGTAPGVAPFNSVIGGAGENGVLFCTWVMPFEKVAALRLTNHTDESFRVSMSYRWGKREWREGDLYFNAKWRAGHGIPTRPRQDWNYVTVEGAGRFVGDMLHVTNPTPAWWGEGDEKIYVDGEAFPSHFGTGTEDYYGYAWCSPELFTNAYHNQPRCDGPGNFGQTCVNRFHILDNIPFTSSFQFDMEVWHWEDVTISQSAVSYWYATAGSADNVPPIDPATLVVPECPKPQVNQVEGALEGEALEVLSKAGGNTQTQESFIWPWSGARQLWWTHAPVGDVLELAFPVEQAGTYEVRGVFTKAVDYGVFQLRINGEAAGGPMDFFVKDKVEPTEELSLGTFDLPEGQNVFSAEVLEPNPGASPGNMLGLDYLRLVPAD